MLFDAPPSNPAHFPRQRTLTLTFGGEDLPPWKFPSLSFFQNLFLLLLLLRLHVHHHLLLLHLRHVLLTLLPTLCSRGGALERRVKDDTRRRGGRPAQGVWIQGNPK